MTASSIKYLTKEGFRNTWTNRSMSIASICVLMCCLVLIGAASMIFVNIDSVLAKIESENVIMVFATNEATDKQLDDMKAKIESFDNISNIRYISKEEAWEQQLATMDEANARFFTEISTDIPLPDSYEITVTNLDLFDKTISDLETLDNVDTIRHNRDVAQKLVTIRQGISVIAVGIVVVLLAISLFIISNTIRLTVYSRRLEISIMKSVGATNGFVRFPFIVEGMILGVVSGGVSLGLVWGIYEFAASRFAELLKSLNLAAVKFNEYALPMLGIFVLIGIFCGVGGSLITMSKYLNKEGSEISGV